MQNKLSLFIAILIALAAILWMASGMFGAATAPDAAQESITKDNAPKKLLSVRVRASAGEEFTSQINLTGRTEASRQIVLKTELDGRITDILVNKGDRVKAGQVVAKIKVNNRNVQLKEAQERVTQREIEYEAAKALTEKGFNSKVKLAQVRADLKEAKAKLEQARLDVGNLNIKAPFDSVIFDQFVESGDYLNVGQDVFELVDLDPIQLTGFVSETDLAAINLGVNATAKLVDGTYVNGVVTYVAPKADPQSRSFRIEIDVKNPDYKIADGSTAHILVPGITTLAHKISPSILSLNDAGEVGVKIVNEDDVVEFIPVDILQDLPDHMWVSGLPLNVLLITVGQDFVATGQRVDPVPSKGDGLL